MASEIPVALTIAGSDCSAGAGAQADLKTFSALGVYGLSALTCIVAETPGKVHRIEAVSAEMVAAQIEILLAKFPIAAIKTGLLHSGEIAWRIAEVLRTWKSCGGMALPVVIDPVMVATSGDLLLQKEAIDVYERELFPLATVITPNLDEAATLLSRKIVDLASMRQAGTELEKRYGVPVLLKGGHLGGTHAIDLLVADGVVTEFSAPFTRGVQTHGTGCTYSAAIAAGLAHGRSLPEVIGEAKDFVTAAIAQHYRWKDATDAETHALNHQPER